MPEKTSTEDIVAWLLADRVDLFANPWDYLNGFTTYAREVEAMWRSDRDELLPEYAKKFPGSRPAAWWIHDSPEPRIRTGGEGSESHRFLTVTRWLWCGMDRLWLSRSEIAFLHLDAQPFNPKNAPTYETEAAYLRRHGLLLAGEARRFTKSAFTRSVILPREFWPYDAR